MPTLKIADYKAILSFVGEIGRVPDLHSFRRGALVGLAGLIPNEQIGYNEIDFKAGSAVVIDLPDPFLWEGVEETLVAHLHEHPLIRYQRSSGDQSAMMISDFLSRSDFHKLAIYNEIYSHLGAEDQIAIGLPGPPWMNIAIAFNRSRNFGERERQILNLVAPHLMHAYWNAIERARLKNAIETAFTGYSRGIVMLDFHGSIVLINDKARQHLADFFGDSRGQLPEELERWLDSVRMTDLGTTPVFRKKIGDKSIRVGFLPAESLDKPEMLVIDTRPREIDIQSLLRVGLTKRQVEVLHLVSRGLTNREIADRMDVSPATIKKHLEDIYTRLGVSSRAEAVAVAFDANWDG